MRLSTRRPGIKRAARPRGPPTQLSPRRTPRRCPDAAPHRCLAQRNRNRPLAAPPRPSRTGA
eukprot:5499028-Lingulodinium_polyedra.AAC.1